MTVATLEPTGMILHDEAGRPDLPVILDARVVTETGGGPDKTILNSPRFLRNLGYHNLCAYMHPPGDPGFEQIRQRAEEAGAPLFSIPDRGALDWRVLGQLLDLCRRQRVALWHGHDYKSNLIGLLLRPFWPMRLVTTVHGWVKQTRRTPLYYRIDRHCLPFYDRVICVSEDLSTQSLGCGVPHERCLVIENGIDTAQFARHLTTAEAKAALGIPTDRLVIGAIGRLSAEKGFDLLIRAADRLVKSGHDLELLIAGDGDRKPELQAMIAGLGREDRFRLLGFRSDTRMLYQAMDVFASSSHREGLPNVLLEAMALEVPIVATRIAGIPRLVMPETNGLLVEAGSLDELTLAIGRLLTDDGQRRRLGQAGRQTVETRYSFEARMQKIRTVYDELLGRLPTQVARRV